MGTLVRPRLDRLTSIMISRFSLDLHVAAGYARDTSTMSTPEFVDPNLGSSTRSYLGSVFGTLETEITPADLEDVPVEGRR